MPGTVLLTLMISSLVIYFMYTCAKSLQSYLTLCDSADCSPPGSSVPGILQARILEWVAMPCSRGSSWSRDQTHISCIAGGFFTDEPPGKPLVFFPFHFTLWGLHKYISHCIAAEIFLITEHVFKRLLALCELPIPDFDSFLLLLLAESLQSCPTLCDPIDSSSSGSPVPGILQARTLEWVDISFSNA